MTRRRSWRPGSTSSAAGCRCCWKAANSTHVRAVPGATETVQNLTATLDRLEPDILALRRGDAASYRAIYAALKPFEIPLHQLVADTMLKDEEIAAAQREGIRRVYWEVFWCFGGITASATILVVLLFRAFRSVSTSLELAHVAEAAASAARAQLKAVIDAVPARISARDRGGGEIFRNRYLAALSAAPPDAGGELGPVDRGVLETGEGVPLFEEVLPDAAGEPRTWLTTKAPLRDGTGGVSGVVTVAVDVSELKEAQRRNALLAAALDHAGDAIEITDAACRFRYVNPAFERISGYAREETVGQTPFALLMPEGEDARYEAVQRVIAGGQAWHGILTARRKDGRLFQQEATLSPVREASGTISHFVAVKRDITDRLRAEARVRHLAHHDPLTGLPNRALFHDRLLQALAEGRRHGERTALLLLDLDRFKDVNDTLGHDAGDALLLEVGRRLLACTREGDTVARLGGDEFALILPRLGSSAAAATVAAKVEEVLAYPVAYAGYSVHVGASVGVTVSPGRRRGAGPAAQERGHRALPGQGGGTRDPPVLRARDAAAGRAAARARGRAAARARARRAGAVLPARGAAGGRAPGRPRGAGAVAAPFPRHRHAGGVPAGRGGGRPGPGDGRADPARGGRAGAGVAGRGARRRLPGGEPVRPAAPAQRPGEDRARGPGGDGLRAREPDGRGDRGRVPGPRRGPDRGGAGGAARGGGGGGAGRFRDRLRLPGAPEALPDRRAEGRPELRARPAATTRRGRPSWAR